VLNSDLPLNGDPGCTPQGPLYHPTKPGPPVISGAAGTKFSASRILQSLQRPRANELPLVPSVLQSLVALAGRHQMKPVSTADVIGLPGRSQYHRVDARHGNASCRTGHRLTQCTPPGAWFFCQDLVPLACHPGTWDQGVGCGPPWPSLHTGFSKQIECATLLVMPSTVVEGLSGMRGHGDQLGDDCRDRKETDA